jgi:hypothetical protein
MKKSLLSAVVTACAFVTTFALAAEMPEFPPPAKEHQWLQQLVGEWNSECEMYPPGMDPIKTQGTESVRSVGGFWTIAENKGSFLKAPFTGVMTLGYDGDKKKYVGTWVDSMSGYLWTYEGSVDASGKVLTLTAEGPCPAAPGELMKFKEVLEIKSPDHKVFTSSFQEKNGQWTTGMKINYTRKK